MSTMMNANARMQLFGFLSFFFIWSIPSDPLPFAAFYSLGNLSSIASFFFLMSPRTQLKRMFHKSRWIPASIMVAAILATITLAIAAPGGAGGIIILLIIVQWVAMMAVRIVHGHGSRAMIWVHTRLLIPDTPVRSSRTVRPSQYCITYIPFGEQMVKGFFGRIFGGGGGGG